MLLKGVSGQFKSGELTAILGPSGSGKSTLLNVLAGYKCTDIGGSININGQLCNLQDFKKISCYIMQNDLVQPNLTVFEAMSFATDLKLGKKKSKSEKCAIINTILNILRLSNTKYTITDKLSGGEKKRLTIALELVNNPPVIFIDEPTTGLDEISSRQCIDVLKMLVCFGRTIVCSVHVPNMSMLQKFDNLYIINNGQCVYRGIVNNLVPFLQNIGLECPKHYNPADFTMEILSGEYGSDVIERMVTYVNTEPLFTNFQSKNELDLSDKNLQISWIYQFNTLVKRMITQFYRNKNHIYMKIWLHIFLGITIGLLFYNMGNDASKSLYNFGFCLISIIIFLYLPMMPVLLKFPTDIKLIQREHFNRWYDLSAYYWALTVVNIPLQIIFVFIYTLLAYSLTGQPLEMYRGFIFFTTCFICAFTSESVGYVIASIFNNVNGVFAGPVLSAVLILLTVQDFGESIVPRAMYQTILMRLTYIRYNLEALMLSIYGYNRPKIPCPPEEIYCHYSSPQKMFKLIKMDIHSSLMMNIFAVLIILFLVKSLMYYLLKQRVQPNKTFRLLRFIVTLFRNYFIH